MNEEIIKTLDFGKNLNNKRMLNYFKTLADLINAEPDALSVLNEFGEFTSVWIIIDFTKSLWFNFENGKLNCEEKSTEPDITFRLFFETFIRVIENRLDAVRAVKRRDISFEGDPTKLFGLFPTLLRFITIKDR